MIAKRRHGGDNLVDVRRDHVMVNIALELREPPRGDLREHGTLVRDRLRHHDVERADTIGRDEQQAIVVDDIHLAHFAAAQMPQRQWLELSDRHTRTSSGSSTVWPASSGATTQSRNS